MGSVLRWQTRWGCEVCYRDRESPADTSHPASYLKAASLRQDKVGQARPHSGHTLRFDHLSYHQHKLYPFISGVVSCCGYPRVEQKTQDVSVTGSGRTLRIRSMAGSPIIRLCNRLFSSVSPFLLLMLTCCSSCALFYYL